MGEPLAFPEGAVKGPVVLLIDETTCSDAEMAAQVLICLQNIVLFPSDERASCQAFKLENPNVAHSHASEETPVLLRPMGVYA